MQKGDLSIISFKKEKFINTKKKSIANAAASIADVVLRELGEHPVIQMSIQESEATIEVATVVGESILVDKTLGEIALGSHTGMYVMAINTTECNL